MGITEKRFSVDWMANRTLFITHLIPNWEDPTWGQHGELYVAMAVRQFSRLISNKALAKKAFELSRQMALGATSGLKSTWDDPGDWPCGTLWPRWWWPWPWPGPPGPGDPDPYKIPSWLETLPSAEQVEIANVFTKLSGLTASAEYNAALKSVAVEIVKGAVGTLLQEFEKCGTKPRPKPRPRK